MTGTSRNGLRSLAAIVTVCFGLTRLASGQAVSTLPLAWLGNASSAQRALAAAQEYLEYPPESRPLHAGNWDLLHPWTVDTPTLPLLPASWRSQVESMRSSGASMEDIARKVTLPYNFPTYNFEVNKLILAGVQDELTARMTVAPAPAAGAVDMPPIHVTRAVVIGDSHFGSADLGSVPFFCEASAPVCTFHWSAPSADKRYWGALELRVTLAVQGQANDFTALLHFYSSPIVAGKFTGSFQERLVNGSLLIDAGVSVQRRMACFVSANLYSADTQVPTHHAERRLIVDPSMQTVTFTFFGKIFRDSGYEGAFRVQDLKAQCENLPYPPEWFMDSAAHQADLEALHKGPATPTEPTRLYFQYNDFAYTTKSYPASAFSDKAWEPSAAALQRLSLMEKAAR